MRFETIGVESTYMGLRRRGILEARVHSPLAIEGSHVEFGSSDVAHAEAAVPGWQVALKEVFKTFSRKESS
jgi:hypothetical protein